MHHRLNLLWFRFRWRVLTWYPTKPIFWWRKKGNLSVNSKPQLYNSNLKKQTIQDWKKRREIQGKKYFEKIPDISRPHHLFPGEMTSDKRVKKFHTDDVWDSASDWLKFASTNQELCPDLGSDASSSVWIFQTSFGGKTSGGVWKKGKQQKKNHIVSCHWIVYFFICLQ